MQRNGTAVPTHGEITVLRAVEALGTAWPRDLAPLTRLSLGAVRQHVWRLSRRGLLDRSEAGYTTPHGADDLIKLMLEGL